MIYIAVRSADPYLWTASALAPYGQPALMSSIDRTSTLYDVHLGGALAGAGCMSHPAPASRVLEGGREPCRRVYVPWCDVADPRLDYYY